MDAGASSNLTSASDEITVVERFMTEAFGNGSVEWLAKLVATDYVGHFLTGDYYGPEGARIEIATYLTAFSDLTVHLDDIFSCRNRVIRRFTLRGTQVGSFQGRPATGKTTVMRGIGVDRVADGLLQESWVLIEAVPHASTNRG